MTIPAETIEKLTARLRQATETRVAIPPLGEELAAGGVPAADITGPWYSLEHHFIIEPGEAKLPRPPITGKATGERPTPVILKRT